MYRRFSRAGEACILMAFRMSFLLDSTVLSIRELLSARTRKYHGTLSFTGGIVLLRP